MRRVNWQSGVSEVEAVADVESVFGAGKRKGVAAAGLWGSKGAEKPAGSKDWLLVHADGGANLLVYFAGLGKGAGTGYTTTALVDSPGATQSLCRWSAVEGLRGMRFGESAFADCGGSTFKGVLVTAAVEFAYAVGAGIAREHWHMAMGELQFLAITDKDFDSIVGDVGRTDCVALLGLDWSRKAAFAPMYSALVDAFNNPAAPVAATHILRSSRLGLNEVRGSQQLPSEVLMHPLAEQHAEAEGMVPLRGGGDKQLHYEPRRGPDWDPHHDRGFQALGRARRSSFSRASAEVLGEAVDVDGDPKYLLNPFLREIRRPVSIPPDSAAGALMRSLQLAGGEQATAGLQQTTVIDADSAARMPDAFVAPDAYMSLGESGRATVVPVKVPWHNMEDMWREVCTKARIGTSDPLVLQALKELLWRHREAFGEMAPRKMDALRLDLLPGAEPSQEGLWRFLAPWQAAEVAKAVDQFIKDCVAEEVFDPAHRKRLNILPIVLVQKPGGRGWRFCLDFRSLNTKLKKHLRHALPDIGMFLDSFADCSLFSVLDELKAFNQVRADDKSADWMACSFIDPRTNERRFIRMRGAMLGLEPLSALYQEGSERVMGTVRAATNEEGRVMIDDFALGSRPSVGAQASITDRHLHALEVLLSAQVERGHVFDLNKCQLLVKEASMLGCVTDGKTTRVDPARMAGWAHMKVPPIRTLKWLGSLMGTLIYAAPRMGPTYHRVASPLWDLLGEAERRQREGELAKDRGMVRDAQRLMGRWDTVHTEAAEECIRLAMENSTQMFLRPGAPCWVTADASDKGFAAYLQQEGEDGTPKIVCILSRRFTTNQRLWSVGARELFALLEFMRRWGHYLAFTSHVTFNTDHLNLLMAEDLENAYVKRWLMELFQWPSFGHMVHLPGRCNALADFLSRWSVAEMDIPPADAALAAEELEEEQPAWWAARKAALAAARSAPPSDSEAESVRSVGTVRRASTRAHPPAADAEGGDAVPAPRRGPAQRRAAQAASAAWTGQAAPVPEFIDNPHDTELSPLLLAIMDAQRELSREQREELLHKKGGGIITFEGEEFITHRGRLVVPSSSPAVVQMLLSLLHDGAAHVKSQKMLDMLCKAQLWLPGAEQICEHYCATCAECIRASAPDEPQPSQGRLLIKPRCKPWANVFLDYATLPVTKAGYSKVVIMVDSATRICMLLPVIDEDSNTSAMALHEWRKVYPPPRVVHTDGGPAFKDAFVEYCASAHIKLDRGTAYNSKGRGLVERLVKKVKEALKRVLPVGRTDEWVSALGDLQILLNRMPHDGLGGLSPQQVGMLDTEPFLPPLFRGRHLEPQAWEDLMDALRLLRVITEIYGEVDEIKRKAAFDSAVTPLPCKEGDWFLVFYGERESSLQSFFRGPFQVVGEVKNGYCVVAPVLAGDKLGPERVEVHVGRLWPFNAERTSSDAEHQKRLPAGWTVVKEIVGHKSTPLGVKLRVKWVMVEAPTWEFVAAMRTRGGGYNAVYKEYCAAHGLRLVDGVQQGGGGGSSV